MNKNNLMHDLAMLSRKWKRDAKSFDAVFNNGPKWIDGVVYGLSLAIAVVRAHAKPPKHSLSGKKNSS